jgi:pyruvate/2-oxoglutarate dehydrogenase complex dihydrolipoamide acyltransferase (E2) component
MEPALSFQKTPEEHRRQLEYDLEHAYGHSSQFAEAPAAQPAPTTPAPSAAKPPAQTPQQNPARGAASQPPPRRDVIAVPLVRHANGLVGLDWNAVSSD